MTDGTGSGIVSVSATGMGLVQALELIPPQLLGIVLSLLGMIATITIICVNVGKILNNRVEHKILKARERKECREMGK